MTLLSGIESILKLDKISGINKEEAMKNTIEHYRTDYPLLERVIQGETSFQETYQPLIEMNEGAKSFFVPQWVEKDKLKVYKENKELINCNLLTTRLIYMLTPLSYAGLVTLVGLFAPPLAVLAGMGVGFIGGLLPSGLRVSSKDDLKEEVAMLDEQIKQLYPSK